MQFRLAVRRANSLREPYGSGQVPVPQIRPPLFDCSEPTESLCVKNCIRTFQFEQAIFQLLVAVEAQIIGLQFVENGSQ